MKVELDPRACRRLCELMGINHLGLSSPPFEVGITMLHPESAEISTFVHTIPIRTAQPTDVIALLQELLRQTHARNSQAVNTHELKKRRAEFQSTLQSLNDADCVCLCYLLGFKGVYFEVWDDRPWITIRIQGMISTIKHGDKIGANDAMIPLDQPRTDLEILKVCADQIEKKKRWINETLKLYVNNIDGNE